jgi:hypothetical protein
MRIFHESHLRCRTLALVNANVARAENRSGPIWFLLPPVVGPMATLALTLASKGR